MGLFDGLFSALGGGPTFTGTAGGMGAVPAGGGGFNWPLFSTILGQMGTAISPRGSWQSRLGQVGSGLGQSAIYGKAASKAQPNFSEYLKAMLGSGLTAPGVAGPTSVKVDKNGETTLQLTPTSTPQQGAQQTATPQSTYNNASQGGMLPFLLAP